MPRGLSDLQKRILIMAHERRQLRDLDAEREEGVRLLARYGYGPDRYFPGPDVYYPEILAEVWGFPTTAPLPAERAERFGEKRFPPRWWGQYFDRDAIGRDAYNKATTTLWRTAERLEGRGLASRGVYGKPGLLLSDEGLAVAERLSVATMQR
ncbi:MAG: hypothetical protein M3Q49_21855 [Actinomycetota bacterium]|nr:hypothetical protein [Actinomycetota bacterium]